LYFFLNELKCFLAWLEHDARGDRKRGASRPFEKNKIGVLSKAGLKSLKFNAEKILKKLNENTSCGLRCGGVLAIPFRARTACLRHTNVRGPLSDVGTLRAKADPVAALGVVME